ncbi:VanW family protein [bacterium]|nr:VanW family protein [bacterium]
MNTAANYPYPADQTPPTFFHKAFAIITGGLGISAVLFLVVYFTLSVVFFGKIFPGVLVNGIDIGGMTQDEALQVLQNKIAYPTSGLIVLEDRDNVWTYTPQDLGLVIDYNATVEKAFKTGRQGWPWQRFNSRIQLLSQEENLLPVLILDERLTRQQLALVAAVINQPVKEAAIRLEGVQVAAEPGQIGRILDVETTIQQLQEPLTKLFDASIILPVNEIEPVIMDVSSQAAIASTILSQPLRLQVPGANPDNLGPWEISPEALAGMMVIERINDDQGERFQIALDNNSLYNLLYPLAPNLQMAPENARFVFNDETSQLEVIQAAVIGRDLMIDETITSINQQILAGAHTVDLVFDYSNPDAGDNVTAAELGITELVHQESTFFYGSDNSRIQNIVTAAGQFHGILVPPGATFSMVDNIGDISLETGYAEAWIIYGDRTIKGVGGGVCQVSTTLFRTVFFAGYPVVERWPHSYRVYYYELIQSGAVNENLAGLDATVYAPVVDFKFTNDTPYWLLMETYVDVAARKLTWKFYSTSDNRQVEWSTTGLTNIVDPPKPVYEENDDLAKGQIKQVDWAVKGAEVTVYRTVTRDGATLYDDTFRTKYEPWAAVCQYGPGTEDYPPPENKQDTYSCNPD